jgi:FkbM family methyltransferase
MAANSPARRLIKRVLYPLVPQSVYSYAQSLALAQDIRTGAYSEPELDLIPLAVRPGETAVDVGANFGLYTYHLSRALGPEGKVYAFEPVPFTCATLRWVARRLGVRNAEIVPKGCSDRGGDVTFSVPIQASGAFSTGQAHIGLRDDDRPGKETQVRWRATRDVVCGVVALDDVVPAGAEVSLIKCDIEGAELPAFRGARRTIAGHLPTVICEINPWFLDGFGIPLGDLTGFFAAAGYSLYSYDGRDRSLRPVPDDRQILEGNYVFIHQRRLGRFLTLFGPVVTEAGPRPASSLET